MTDRDHNFAEWFFDQGVGVFPIITPGKTPACKSWDDYVCTREQAARFRNYGVRLGRLAVVDSDNPATVAWVAAHVPPTPFRDRTFRGWHRFYRAVDPLPKFIHRDGHTIELRNVGQYVVGPGSVHASGVTYSPVAWSWRWEDIPYFPPDFVWDDRAPGPGIRGARSYVVPDMLCENERHYGLYQLMRSLAARGVPVDGALAACYIENAKRCRPPLTDLRELDGYLRRAYHRRDSADFVRSADTGWVLAGSLLEIGLSVEATLAAVRSVSPDFDPRLV
jgi:hypothetical protein